MNDLHVGDEIFSGDRLIAGFHKHFSELAQPSDNYIRPRIFQPVYDIIESFVIKVSPRKVTVEEVKEAIAAINRGKSDKDICGLSIENIYYAGEDLIKFLHELI